MLSVEELADLPPRQYLERFNVEFYLRDVICLFLARRRGDTRSPPEFISQYLDTVLRGEHVLQRGFKYVNGTALNRRAFVLSLRQGLRGVSSPETTALTAHDFHDLVTHVCSDFPLAVVLEAARHARPADARRHHLLGETAPFAGSLSSSDGDKGAAGDCCHTLDSSTLLVFRSLQRMAEFCLVYSELLGALKHMFREDHGFWPPRAGAGESGALGIGPAPPREDGSSTPSEAVTWLRAELVSEIRFYGSALSGAALPSERALRRLLRPEEAGGGSAVCFAEVLAEMAEHFELVPEVYPEDLLGRADPLSSEAPSVSTAETGVANPPAARPGTSGAPADRRRRERSLKAKGRS